MRHTGTGGGRDGGREGAPSHLTGQGGSSLGVFEGEALQRVVARPPALQLLVKALLILQLQARAQSRPGACWVEAFSGLCAYLAGQLRGLLCVTDVSSDQEAAVAVNWQLGGILIHNL